MSPASRYIPLIDLGQTYCIIYFATKTISLSVPSSVLSHFSISTIYSLDKSKALSLVLHCCDISHPSKMWQVHERWTKQLLEEFFRQGDREHELGLPYSPLCDRKNTLVAQSQIGKY